MRYRKKPVVIEAFVWTGGPDQTEDPEWIIEKIESGDVTFEPGAMLIHTLEGVMRAGVGDYVIRGVQGEIYPCKESIFRETYEAVED